MMIEIHGAAFSNKGAQLMIRTVIDRVQMRFPEASFCLETASDAQYPQLAEYGLHMLYPQASYDRSRRMPYYLPLSALAGRIIPRSFTRPFGLVRRQDTDALIDVSGYAFGDKFGITKARLFNKRASLYHRYGKPVILLPQMLGPFEKPGFRDAMTRMVDSADLFFARDRMSLDACKALLREKAAGIRLAPDITIFSSPGDRSVPMPEDPMRTVALVPNIRMLDKGDPRWKDEYIPRLTAAGRHLIERGFSLHIVIHETRGSDAELGHRLREAIDADRVPVIQYEDPLDLKAYLGRCRFIIASRFHAVVGALSSGVPAVVIGWAHKYDMLLEDFGTPDTIHRADEPAAALLEHIDRMLDDTQREQTHQTLARHKGEMKPANDQMWQAVFETLEPRS